MANEVFANGMEICCKAASGKSVAAFPDVCFTPPLTPATPPGVPIPYPNNAMAGDTTDGSKKVKISGKEVMLRNKSYLKKNTGDEAGNAPKKGFVTTSNTGKAYFAKWSMDVKIEKKNVVRHFDITTHNHMSMPGNTPPWAYIDSQAGGAIKGCENEVENAETACKGKLTRKAQCKSKECRDAKRCLLVTYKQGKRTGKMTQVGCCDGEQPHHLVEAHCFYQEGKRGQADCRTVKAPRGKHAYNDDDAPCVCAKGPRHAKEHGKYHAFQQKMEAAHHEMNGKWTYKDARDTGVKAHTAIHGQCSPGCTEAQLDAYHKDRCGMEDRTELRTDPQAGTRSTGKLTEDQAKALQAALRTIKKMISRKSSV